MWRERKPSYDWFVTLANVARFALGRVLNSGAVGMTQELQYKKPPVFQRFGKVKLKRDKVIWAGG